jgi:benzoate membrane transport protein
MISAALVAALVGYGSSVAIVLAAAQAVGATPAQTASWVLALCWTKAAGSAFLSWRYRMPVVLAWSTPGAVLIAGTAGIGMAEAAGAFLVSSLMIAAAGLVRPLGRAVAMIPDAIAAAMLGGVLLTFVLKGALALPGAPGLILPMVAVFAVVRLWNPALAVLAALAVGVGLALALGAAVLPRLAVPAPAPVLVAPAFDAAALLGLALPLFLVTMAAQNLPGFATLRAAGYDPPVGPALAVTGGLSAVGSLFGAHHVNMAAITAAICLSPEVDPDPATRWRVGIVYAAVWLLLGLVSPPLIAVIAALPAPLVAGIVALALLAPLSGALAGAFAVPDQRFAATLTLTVAGSGVVVAGIGGAFWGLLAGLGLIGLDRLRRLIAPRGPRA